ncbi:MAG TPA: TRAP transporter fused permease subunit [Alphaproteobacteria bacterium]|nr:TRAP transporter fused permease subunit [Alphaproteobacteria bacterium]
MRQAPPPPSRSRLVDPAVTTLACALTLGSLFWAADLYRRAGLQLYTEQFVAGMLALALPLAFIHFRGRAETPRHAVPWYDWLAAGLAAVAGWYLAIRYPKLVDLILLRPADGVALGVALIVLTIEALRRSAGRALSIIVVCFVLYGLFGDLMPGELAGRASDWRKLAAYLAIDVNGMLGAPIVVACTVVVMFVLFGDLLAATGGAQFYNELALALMGRFRGGSAKIAVVSSALFGAISGSAVANVVAQGIVTIPMMKRDGYRSHKAAAIEAVASTGGQLMPPVMGASAFLMAEFLQISYGEVVLAALAPALLYYVALVIQADLEAGRAGIAALDRAELPALGAVMAAGWHFLTPFAVILAGLFWLNMQPETAALAACIVLVATSLLFGYRGARPSAGRILRTFKTAGVLSLEIVLITAAAGIVIGVLSLSGLGFTLTFLLVQIGKGSLLLLLLLAAIVCVVLGMGLPTVGVYVLLAALVAPALVELGVLPIAAHLFVMYFGMMSMITPPVALAAYAAASLGQADPMATGWEACRFGWSTFLVPFLFVLSPTLLLIGDPASVAVAIATAAIGVWLVSIGIVGFFLAPIGAASRAMFVLAGFLALIPAGAFTGAVWTDVVGVVGGAILLFREYAIARARRAAPLAAGHRETAP